MKKSILIFLCGIATCLVLGASVMSVQRLVVQDYAKVEAPNGADTFLIITDNTDGTITTNGTFKVTNAGGLFFLRNGNITWYIDDAGGASFPSLIVDTDATVNGTLTAGAVTSTSTVMAAGDIASTGGGLAAVGAGYGLSIKEGLDCKIGITNLTGGSVVIPNTSITSISRVFLARQEGGVLANVGNIGVTARTAGTSFTVSSINASDNQTFVYFIVEPIIAAP